MRKIVLFALLGLLAVSCSNDGPTIIEQDILGAWEAVETHGTPNPVDMPKYIKFDGIYYYSSNSEPNPSSNQQGYTITFNNDLGRWVLNISGDSREYRITLNNQDGILDLSYVLPPADPENDVEEQRQSLPYKRTQ